MAKITQAQIEQREDYLAKQEYGIPFEDLPPDIKQKVHNAALDYLGVRMVFKFKCLDCGTVYEEEIDRELATIYTEIQSETNKHIIESVCPFCLDKRNGTEIEREVDEWARKSESVI